MMMKINKIKFLSLVIFIIAISGCADRYKRFSIINQYKIPDDNDVIAIRILSDGVVHYDYDLYKPGISKIMDNEVKKLSSNIIIEIYGPIQSGRDIPKPALARVPVKNASGADSHDRISLVIEDEKTAYFVYHDD
jgi:hypothetical protein